APVAGGPMPDSIRNSPAAVIKHSGNTREEVERTGDHAQRRLSATPGLKTRPTSEETGGKWRARRDSNAGPRFRRPVVGIGYGRAVIAE
ncbi:MAG: hypothetical protein H6Q86_4404, partial [candidate division NC10 bacterium]|nr:hypothetical protein [candidate division NC10 bacterium]